MATDTEKHFQQILIFIFTTNSGGHPAKCFVSKLKGTHSKDAYLSGERSDRCHLRRFESCCDGALLYELIRKEAAYA